MCVVYRYINLTLKYINFVIYHLYLTKVYKKREDINCTYNFVNRSLKINMQNINSFSQKQQKSIIMAICPLNHICFSFSLPLTM